MDPVVDNLDNQVNELLLCSIPRQLDKSFLSPLFASDAVRELGLEAGPDRCPPLHFPTHGISGVLESQKPRQKKVFYSSFLVES